MTRWLVALALLGGCQLVFPLTDEPNRVFVTSRTFPANFGNAAKADEACATAATDGGLEGTFVAWMSASDRDMRTLLRGSRGWTRIDNEPVADQPAELFLQGPRVPINRTEGALKVDGIVWTGMRQDGELGETCSEWGASTGNGTAGYSFGGRLQFTDNRNPLSCMAGAHLYCFEVGRNVEIAPGRKTGNEPVIFVSTSTFSGDSVLTVGDPTCQTEALPAFSGTFMALVGTMTVSALQRVNVSPGASFVRSDGVAVGPLSTAPLSFVNRTADGELAPDGEVWTGGAPAAAPDPETCGGWTSAQGTSRGSTGLFDLASDDMYRFTNQACSEAHPVYCVQTAP